MKRRLCAMTRSESNAATSGNGPQLRRRSNLFSSAAAGAAALVAVFASPVAAQVRAPAMAHRGAPQLGAEAPTIDWALSGQATATASQSANPPSNAIDGDAATSWCTNSWPDTLTVDLGQVRQLDGIGITLDNSSSSARASISVATQEGQWQPVPEAQNIALDPGNPMYVPLSPVGSGPIGPQGGPPGHGFVAARYAQLTVWDSGSAPVCVGEFRMFGPAPQAAGMVLGADMSFTSNEL